MSEQSHLLELTDAARRAESIVSDQINAIVDVIQREAVEQEMRTRSAVEQTLEQERTQARQPIRPATFSTPATWSPAHPLRTWRSC